MGYVIMTTKAKKASKITTRQAIEIAQKNLFKSLASRTANISESKFIELQKNNVSRLKQSEKYAKLDNDVIEFIAAHTSNIEVLLNDETPIKTAKRVAEMACYLLDKKTSVNCIYTISTIQKLHKNYTTTTFAQIEGATFTDKSQQQQSAITKNLVKALQLFNVLIIGGEKHHCGASFTKRIGANDVIAFNDEVMKTYELAL
jgi:hypothetical protein